MKPKHAFILVAVVALIVAAIAVSEYVVKPRAEKKKQVSELFFPDFDPAKATEIDLGVGDTATVLTRAGDTVWKVKSKGGYPADPESVKVLLDGLKALKHDSLASESKDNHERLGVLDTAPRVRLKNGAQTLADLLIGNQGQNVGTFFVRKPGEDQTYLVLDDVKNWTDGAMGEWRDKTIFKEDMINLDTVTFTLRTETVAAVPGATPIEKNLAGVKIYTIRRNRDKDSWEYVTGDTVVTLDKGKTDGLMQTLVDLKAVEFADTVSPDHTALNPPNKEAAFKMQGGRAFGLYVGKSDGAKFYVRRSDLDLVMKVYRYQIDNIFKSKEALLAPAGPGEESPGNVLPPPDLPPPVIRAPGATAGDTTAAAPPKPLPPPYPPPNEPTGPEEENPPPPEPPEEEPPSEPTPPPPPPVDDSDIGGLPPKPPPTNEAEPNEPDNPPPEQPAPPPPPAPSPRY